VNIEDRPGDRLTIDEGALAASLREFQGVPETSAARPRADGRRALPITT
jgi:hypothetical protein